MLDVVVIIQLKCVWLLFINTAHQIRLSTDSNQIRPDIVVVISMVKVIGSSVHHGLILEENARRGGGRRRNYGGLESWSAFFASTCTENKTEEE